ncbi:hypothetical protein SAMN05421858_1406 [Haladaptatus litoreus]|uniref:Uncharacterized protein n=1 Tax=Haladaptatus litoreus TaxID=553468 RepID=A0A1N6Y599_9EURY|nr:hypothetical protein SAMN05421858_1406 [Haladaptatus litoreus]
MKYLHKEKSKAFPLSTVQQFGEQLRQRQEQKPMADTFLGISLENIY